MSEDATDTVPIPLAAFSAMLRPQLIKTSTVRSRRAGDPPHTIPVYGPGHPDEIWLKLLEMEHGIERHTATQWHGLIEYYKKQPAHPADTKYVPGS